MSDEGLQARVVSNDGFAWRAEGPVTAFAVQAGDAVHSYVWYADDESQDAAGVVSVPAAGARAANESVALAARLRAAHAAGTAAKDAVLGLQGPVGQSDDGVVVGTEALTFPALQDLRELGRTQAGEFSAPSSVRTPGVDAMARRDAAADRQRSPQIAEIDLALAARPTPEPLRVWLDASDIYVDDVPAVGSITTEATYLRSGLLTRTTDFRDATVVLVLDVPAGVPALWLDSDDPAGTLLLARGRSWRVDGVERERRRTVVTGTMLP